MLKLIVRLKRELPESEYTALENGYFNATLSLPDDKNNQAAIESLTVLRSELCLIASFQSLMQPHDKKRVRSTDKQPKSKPCRIRRVKSDRYDEEALLGVLNDNIQFCKALRKLPHDLRLTRWWHQHDLGSSLLELCQELYVRVYCLIYLPAQNPLDNPASRWACDVGEAGTHKQYDHKVLSNTDIYLTFL